LTNSSCILSHVLAQRLKKVLPKIINVDQTGYVKNRFIGFNLRQIQDIIDYTDIYKIEEAINIRESPFLNSNDKILDRCE
jgi:hypothetical protein